MAKILDPKRVVDTALRALFWVWFYCIFLYAGLACMELILMLPELVDPTPFDRCLGVCILH